ncbi:MAG: energy transducer TonB [Zoogloeaceae bacterium]|jgi:protein TonB|nr:energy transducer TonB [Zoogloeaceae bacterium]
MSIPPSGKAVGTLPVFWRATLFAGILSMHGLGLAFLPRMGANSQGTAGAPVILQASWIAAPLQAEEPVVAPPPIRPRVKASRRPLAHRPKKPVLAKPADTPEPLAQTIATPEAQPREDVPISESAPEMSEESPAAEASGLSLSTPAAAPAPGRGGGPVIPPSHAGYLSNPRPEYPARSRAQGEQGVVYLRVRVSAEGSAHSVTLNKSCGHERLDRAAIEAVWRWRFVPARQDGHPVAGLVIIPIRFDLRS